MIRSLLDEAAEGRGGMLIFRGESGAGKSRLLHLAAAEATDRGWWTASGRAYPMESGIPHALFADSLPHLVRAIPPDALSPLVLAAGPEVASLFPVLNHGPAATEDRVDDPREFRTRVFWNFSEFLGRIAERRPLLLAFDDLQWADASSLELLHFLARQLHDRRIAITCAYNPLAEEQGSQLTAIRQSLVGIGAARTHGLELLSEADTGRLIQQTFDMDTTATREFASLLHRWTQGSPFFLDETLKALVDSGRLQQLDGVWCGWETKDLELPENVREAVIARLSQISPAAREQADLLAVIGTSVAHDALVALSAVAEDTLVAAIGELRVAGIIEEGLEGDILLYDFANPLIRETLYTEMGLARARFLHARVAESLEIFLGTSAPDHAGALAYHYAGSHARRLAPKAVRYLSLAGRAALARYADREAAEYLSAALEGSGGAVEDDPMLLEDLARARQRLGHLEEAAELANRQREMALAANDSRGMAVAERRLGLIDYRRGHHLAALERFTSAADWAERAGLGRLATRLWLLEADCLLEIGRASDAQHRIEVALASAELLGERSLLARVHLALLFLHTWSGPPQDARAHGERVLALLGEVEDQALLCTAHWGLTVLAGLTGDPRRAAVHSAACVRLAEELRSPLHRLRAAELEIELLTNSGDWDEALSLGESTCAEPDRAASQAPGFHRNGLLRPGRARAGKGVGR